MKRRWNFLTNHGHVLICLSDDPCSTLREIAERVDITERATSRIVNELVQEGAVERTRHGRRNRYKIKLGFPLRHSLERNCSVGQLLDMVAGARRNHSK